MNFCMHMSLAVDLVLCELVALALSAIARSKLNRLIVSVNKSRVTKSRWPPNKELARSTSGQEAPARANATANAHLAQAAAHVGAGGDRGRQRQQLRLVCLRLCTPATHLFGT